MSWINEILQSVKKSVQEGVQEGIHAYSDNASKPNTPPSKQSSIHNAMELISAVYHEQQQQNLLAQAKEILIKQNEAEQILYANLSWLNCPIDFVQYQFNHLIHTCKTHYQNEPEQLKLSYQTIVCCLKLAQIIAPNDMYARSHVLDMLLQQSEQNSALCTSNINSLLKSTLLSIGHNGNDYQLNDQKYIEKLEVYANSCHISDPKWHALEMISKMRKATFNRYNPYINYYIYRLNTLEDSSYTPFDWYWIHLHAVEMLCKGCLSSNERIELDCDWNNSLETWQNALGCAVSKKNRQLVVFHFERNDSDLLYSVVTKTQASQLSDFCHEYQCDPIIRFLPALNLEKGDHSPKVNIKTNDFESAPDSNDKIHAQDLSSNPRQMPLETINAEQGEKCFPELDYSTRSRIIKWAIDCFYDEIKNDDHSLFTAKVDYLKFMLKVMNLIAHNDIFIHFSVIKACQIWLNQVNEAYVVHSSDAAFDGICWLYEMGCTGRNYYELVQSMRTEIKENLDIYRGIFATILENTNQSLEDCVFEDLKIQRNPKAYDEWMVHNVVIVDWNFNDKYDLENDLMALLYSKNWTYSDMPEIDLNETEQDTLKRWSSHIPDKALVRIRFYDFKWCCYIFLTLENATLLSDYFSKYYEYIEICYEGEWIKF